MIITCDTPIESLLDANAVEELANEYANIVTTEVNNLTTTLTTEQKKGLSQEAFSLDNDSILYEKGVTIIGELSNISADTSSWKSEIINKAKEKRKEEVEELKSKVYEKLVELSGELAQLSFQSILNKSPDIVSKQENLKQLFDPFFRIDKSRSRNTGGSGLGLYIAKTVFDYHNIQYKIENTKRGVLFTIILPSNR